MGEFLGPILALVFLLFIYGIALGIPLRGVRRSRIEIRTLGGPNAGLVLATLAIAQLLFELGIRTGDQFSLSLLILVAFGSVALLLLARGVAVSLVGIGGLISFLVATFLEDGPEVGVWFVVVAAALVILLSILRPFAR
jgi:hypothetical protein